MSLKNARVPLLEAAAQASQGSGTAMDHHHEPLDGLELMDTMHPHVDAPPQPLSEPRAIPAVDAAQPSLVVYARIGGGSATMRILDDCARFVLRVVLWITGVRMCEALWQRSGPSSGHVGGSAWWRACVTAVRILFLGVMLGLLVWRQYIRLLVIRSTPSLALAVGHSVLIPTTTLLLLCGWRAVATGALPLTLPQRTSGRRVGEVDVLDELPRKLLRMLAAGFLALTGMSLLAIVWRSADYGVPATSMAGAGTEEVTWLVWNATRVVSIAAPHFAACVLLSAHALRFARRIHAVALRLPLCPTPVAARVLEVEERLLHRHMHDLPVSLLLLALALVVVVLICVLAHVLTEAVRDHPLFTAVALTELVTCVAGATAALYCVAEVTEGWMAAVRALHRVKAEHGAMDLDRLGLATMMQVMWQQGLVGLRVFGVLVSRGLVVKGLWTVGTLLALLLRMQPSRRSAEA